MSNAQSHTTLVSSAASKADKTGHIPLTKLAVAIAEYSGQPPPPYRQLYKAILDGDIESERIGREHAVRHETVPQIAAFFGLSAAA